AWFFCSRGHCGGGRSCPTRRSSDLVGAGWQSTYAEGDLAAEAAGWVDRHAIAGRTALAHRLARRRRAQREVGGRGHDKRKRGGVRQAAADTGNCERDRKGGV